MARAKETLDQWIRGAITDPDKDGKCTSIALVHMMGTVEKEVFVKKLGDKISADAPFEMAEMFVAKAEGYSEGLPGMQTFQLLAFYNNRSKEQSARTFIVQGYMQLDGLSTESPTSQGLLQQMMRHVEAMAAAHTRKDGILMDYMSRTIEEQGRREHLLRTENVEMFSVLKDMIVQQSMNSHTRRLAELQYQRQSEERKELGRAAVGLLNTVTGREVVSQSTEDTAIVEMFIEGIVKAGPQALQALSALNLPQTTMLALASRFEKAMKAREAVTIARAPNGIDPEDDVNGGMH